MANGSIHSMLDPPCMNVMKKDWECTWNTRGKGSGNSSCGGHKWAVAAAHTLGSMNELHDDDYTIPPEIQLREKGGPPRG